MSIRTRSLLAICAALAALDATPAAGGAPREIVPGPVPFEVLKVHDGDSFSGEAAIWPGQRVAVSIRIRGIDTPEMRSKCAAERQMARLARSELARRLADKGGVELRNIGGGKYHGRVLADVRLADGADLAAEMLQTRLARPYRGRKRAAWCDSQGRLAPIRDD